MNLVPIATAGPQLAEVRVALIDEVIATDGRVIEVIDTATGERHALVAVAPLEIGDDPAIGERFGSLDVGGDRIVVFETTTGGAPTHINIVTALGGRTDVGEGLHPAIRSDGSAFAFVGPNALTVMWSGASLLDDGLEFPGTVRSIRFSPDGSRLAVAWESQLESSVTIVEVEPNGFADRWDVPQPKGRRYSLPAWVDDQLLGVLDIPAGSDGPGTLLTLDSESGTVTSSVRLNDAIVDVDHVVGGATALIVTLEGRIKWVAAGASGLLIDAFHTAARW